MLLTISVPPGQNQLQPNINNSLSSFLNDPRTMEWQEYITKAFAACMGKYASDDITTIF
jgi:hypothetical protein